MKFTKKQFKTFFHKFSALSFICLFGVGHLIACNTPSDISKPVITVPVNDINYVLSPDDIYDNGLGQLDIQYNFSTTYSWNSVSYNLYSNLSFSVINDNLTLQVDHTYYDLSTLQQTTWQGELSLGSYEEFTVDIVLRLSYRMDLPMIDEDYNFLITTQCYVQNQVNNLLCNNYYSRSAISGFFEPTTYVNDSISYEFFQFAFITYPSLPATYRQEGIDYVLNHLSDYDLYTYEQYIAYGQQQRELGRQESANVLSLGGFVREIFRAPISMFKNAFNFVLPLPDGTSLDVSGILTFFLTIGIALTIVSLITKIGGK